MATRDDLLEYAEEQLDLAGRRADETRVVLTLLEVLYVDWPEVNYDWALTTAKKLLDGEHLEEVTGPGDDEGTWAPILLGDGTRPGHAVRVKSDAYPNGRFAHQHNGRLGTFAGARNGFVYVKYTDETKDVHPQAHRPDLVEKQV